MSTKTERLEAWLMCMAEAGYPQNAEVIDRHIVSHAMTNIVTWGELRAAFRAREIIEVKFPPENKMEKRQFNTFEDYLAAWKELNPHFIVLDEPE